MNSDQEKKLLETIIKVCRMDNASGYVDDMLAQEGCDLINNLGFDSLLLVDLIIEIEDALDFEFDMNKLDVNKIRKLDGLKEMIGSYLSEE